MLHISSMIRQYFKTAFRWQRGRQMSGYDKMLLLHGLWPLPFDLYLLRFPEGAEIPAHVDTVQQGAHYRLNIVIWQAESGGEFICDDPIYTSRRVKYFRPDISKHSVTHVCNGTRYVLSTGWILRK
jgi:hypothetical protein